MSSTTWFTSAISPVPLFAATLLFAPALAAADRADTQPTVVEEIVAKVNGEIVTRGELDKQRLVFEAELRQQGLIGQALQDAANRKVADGLRDQIDQLLLVQKGKELNINVDADVNRRIAQIQSTASFPIPTSDTWPQEQTGETYEDFKQL